MDLKLFNKLSYVAVGIVFVLLILMITKVFPAESFPYVLGFSIFLLVLRLIFRIYFLIQSKKSQE